MIAPNSRILWLPEGDARNFNYETGKWTGGDNNASGVRIDPESAIRSTVVLACVRVLATSVASLPLHLYRRLPNGGKELARDNPLYRVLHDSPNSWQTSFEWRETLMLHLCTWGQAFVEISGAGPDRQLIVLHPSRMKVERIENGRLRYTYRESNGTQTVYTQDAIMHLRWMSDDGVNGMVPVELARDAIGLARACELHAAAFFGNGARPGVILSTDQVLSPEAAENTRAQWERAHRGADRSNRTAVLQGGLKVTELGTNNQEAQFLEARRFQVAECCRLYGVPLHMVGELQGGASYASIEQASLDYLQNGLLPWLRRIESAIARDLIADDNLFAEFDTRGALRTDVAARSSYYQTLWNLGVASVNEIRGWENMNPVEGGDTRFVQLNMTTLANMAGAIPAKAGDIQPFLDRLASGTITPEAAKSLIAATNTMLAPEQVDAIVAGAQAASQPDKAQVTALLQVIADVASGILKPEGATAIIGASFPQLDASQVAAIVGGVKVGSEQTPVQPAEPSAAAQPAAKPTAEVVPADPTEDPLAAASAGVNMASTALNGAQVTALIEVLAQVSQGNLSKDSAVAIITSAFPTISDGVADEMVSGAIKVTPPTVLPDASRSLAESRAMTISIDFDRTFAADPSLWGDFARQAKADGNTVVMVSRREDTPEDRQTVTDTLGDYASAFSQVLLVGSDTLKEDGAKAAGVDVDVWVDDSPQTITDKPAPEPKKRSRGKKSDGEV